MFWGEDKLFESAYSRVGVIFAVEKMAGLLPHCNALRYPRHPATTSSVGGSFLRHTASIKFRQEQQCGAKTYV